MARRLGMVGRRLKADGRALRYIDSEVIALFKQVLSMYGTQGTKFILDAIVNGRLKPKF